MTADRDHRRFYDCRIAFVPRVPSQPSLSNGFQGSCCTSVALVAASEMGLPDPKQSRTGESAWPIGEMLDACPGGSPRRAPRMDQVLGWVSSKLSECVPTGREALRRQTLNVGARVSEDGGPCEDHQHPRPRPPITGKRLSVTGPPSPAAVSDPQALTSCRRPQRGTRREEPIAFRRRV